MHKKIVEVKPELFVKQNVKRLQIIECNAEITLLGESSSLVFSNSSGFSNYYKNKHPKYSKLIGEEYFETALDVLYNRFNKMLSDNGLFPIEKESVINNSTYIKNELNKKDYTVYNGGRLSEKNEQNFIVCSSGMRQLPQNLDYDSAEEFNQQLARIANDNEVDAALKLNIGITINEDGYILLTKYDVTMDTWLTAYKKGKETEYKWKLIDTELFNLKSEIKGAESHKDLESLDSELINILNSVTEMYSYSLSSYL